MSNLCRSDLLPSELLGPTLQLFVIRGNAAPTFALTQQNTVVSHAKHHEFKYMLNGPVKNNENRTYSQIHEPPLDVLGRT